MSFWEPGIIKRFFWEKLDVFGLCTVESWGKEK